MPRDSRSSRVNSNIFDMKRLIVVTLIAISSISFGQDYTNAIGFRGGFSQGLTFKHFISSTNAIEGILATRYHGYNLTGLYEIHANGLFDVDGLNLYYGFGAHVGRWNSVYWSNSSWNNGKKYYTVDANGNVVYYDYTVIGVDGIVGIEYNISEIPINISLDYKPAINLVGYQGLWLDNGAFSVRYYF